MSLVSPDRDGYVSISALSIFFSYIVQLNDPGRAVKMWTDTLELTLDRQYPTFFFMPNSEKSIAEEIFNLRDTERIANILVAEYNNSTDWPVLLFTNNFRQSVGTLGRNGKIFLDRWNAERRFENDENLFPNKLQDLGGKEFRVMAFTYLPYVNIDPLDGIEVRVTMEFCKKLNCTLQIVDDGGLWGSIQGNGSGDGLVGMVYKDEADIGVGGSYLWLENHFYTDFSSTYLYAAATLLVPKPKPLSGWRVPFLPFSWPMWFIIILSILMAALLMYIITALLKKIPRFTQEVKRKKQFVTYTDSFFRVLGMAVMQQPTQSLVQNSPLKHLLTAFEFFFLIITVYYSAGLSSFLTVPQLMIPIDTFHQLAASNLKWIANHEAWIYSIQHVDDPEVQTVVKNFRIMTGQTLIEKAQTGKYGVGIERLPAGHFVELPHITETIIDKSHVMKENLFGSPLTFIMRKGSPYLENFNKIVNNLVDSGILLFWEAEVARRFLTTRKQIALSLARSSHLKSGPKILTLGHIQGAFIVYGTGMILATIIFVVELRKAKNKMNK
ncbi:glutamate receptor-like isoform X1 [Cimex lectularius]|uniref:Ionotropic glutamate receptor C-terminal domain-containing protein n=2 Tax=Cimex lectularius TaxID=79782 RepID=A0A8I6REG9_CIMLE|nr:glutamate receptor-like isoform X1 [Cimex lectularius]